MFEFLRETPVNLLRYLPSFLADDASFKDTEDTLSAEHEKQRQMLIDLAKQFFISTATWSLPHYEQIYEVTPNPGDTYEQRRNRILLKIQSNQTSTIAFLESLAERYMTAGSTAVITEDSPNYSFRLTTDNGSILYIDDLIEAIETYKPAHVGWEITVNDQKHIRLYVGSLLHDRSTKDVWIAPLPDMIMQKVYIGAVARMVKNNIHIRPAELTDIATGLSIGIFMRRIDMRHI